MKIKKQLIFPAIISLLSAFTGLQAEDSLRDLRKISSRKHYSQYELTFKSSVRSPYKNNNIVYAEVFLPVERTVPVPVVIILPGIAEPNKWIEHKFCRKLAGKGIASILIELPYQFHRRPYPGAYSKELFLSDEPEILVKNFEQAIEDARSAVEWARSRAEFDGSAVGVLGVSLGSLIGLVVMGSDPEITGGVFILGGIDLTEIFCKGAYTRKLSRAYAQQGYSREALQKLFTRIEPGNNIKNLKSRPVKLYNARWDRIIPKNSVLKLRNALPSAEKHWLFGGHYSVMMHIFWVPKAATEFFSDIFNKD